MNYVHRLAELGIHSNIYSQLPLQHSLPLRRSWHEDFVSEVQQQDPIHILFCVHPTFVEWFILH